MEFSKEELLEKAKEILSEDLLEFSYNLVIAPLEIEDFTDNDIVLILPSSGQKNMLENNHLDALQEAFNFLTNKKCNITILDSSIPNEIENYRKLQKETKYIQATDNYNSNLNPNFTFDSFVIGNNNRIAAATANAVATDTRDEYNPLFIYGGPGLGKTHLMHAVANKILENKPNSRIVYVSSENFLNDLVNSIKSRNSDTEKFRNKYRNVDVFIMDDVQFLSGKDSAQQELFNTFNDLKSKGKQIILSADTPPKSIPVLEDRLRSRFHQGVIVDIGVPDFETRLAILRLKTEEKNIIIDDNVLSLIAEQINSNIRDLEGVLNKVTVIASFTKMPITLEIAQKAINEIMIENENVITPDVILDVISNYFDVPKKDILSSKKSQEIVFPRQIAMYLFRSELNLPYKKIGELFGKKDHTTIMHAEAKVKKNITQDKNTQLIVESVENLLKNINK